MSLLEIILLGIGLSMDAFAVAVCKGMEMKKFKSSHAFIISLAFGGFQALMPVIGWLLGSSFAKNIEAFDHWIAFGLLAAIGIKMIADTVKEMREEEEKEEKEKEKEYSLKPLELILLAIATSIDALAVGFSFAFLDMGFISSFSQPGVLLSVLIIGCITFLLSFGGVFTGTRFGGALQTKAQIVGGIILILIGVKILLEHLEILKIF